jgi:hypothetical protein
MCTELLPPGGYPIAVKYIISYHIFSITGVTKQLSIYQTQEHNTAFFKTIKPSYLEVTYKTSINPPTTDSKIQNLCARMPVFEI